MRKTIHRLLLMTAGFAVMIMVGGEGFAQVPHKEQREADALEKLARAEFGQLSGAERTFVRGAASRNLQWVGPNDNPDDPANDPAKTEKWSPDRNIRAGLFAWLVADPEAAPFLHPSGPGIAGAKIVGKLDLTYAEVSRPLTLIRCAIPDGIDFSNASLAGIELRSSVSGPITGDFAHIKGDLALRPIFHQLQKRIEAHILIAFLAFCLHADNSASNYPPKVPKELHLAVRSNPSRLRPACSEDLLIPVLYL